MAGQGVIFINHVVGQLAEKGKILSVVTTTGGFGNSG
jgi:hypothetical protein